MKISQIIHMLPQIGNYSGNYLNKMINHLHIHLPSVVSFESDNIVDEVILEKFIKKIQRSMLDRLFYKS